MSLKRVLTIAGHITVGLKSIVIVGGTIVAFHDAVTLIPQVSTALNMPTIVINLPEASTVADWGNLLLLDTSTVYGIAVGAIVATSIVLRITSNWCALRVREVQNVTHKIDGYIMALRSCNEYKSKHKRNK